MFPDIHFLFNILLHVAEIKKKKKEKTKHKYRGTSPTVVHFFFKASIGYLKAF